MKLNSGKNIVFEGVDAVGKTTLCNHLCNFLSTTNVPFKQFHFPGKENGTLGGLVNDIHHSHSAKFGIDDINPCSLQLLHVAAHVDTIEASIYCLH
jgi:dTMP kinase